MKSLAEFIKDQRLDKGWSKRKLSLEAGISHTEIHRIESGERKNPSIPVLNSIADALEVSREEMLQIAGYIPAEDNKSLIERAFPKLKTQKQQETIQKIVDGLARNKDLEDQDYEDLVQQMEMFLDYAQKKKNTP